MDPLAQIASYAMPVLMLAAFAVLLSKTGSPWLIAAIVFEALSLLCRVALGFGAGELMDSRLFTSLWQLFVLLIGACFLGFAVTWQGASAARRRNP
jgi:hypothetical protein